MSSQGGYTLSMICFRTLNDLQTQPEHKQMMKPNHLGSSFEFPTDMILTMWIYVLTLNMEETTWLPVIDVNY